MNYYMLGLFALNAYADELFYSFVSAEHANGNVDDVVIDRFGMDFSFGGYGLRGSVEINESLFAEMRYLTLENKPEARTFTSPAPIGSRFLVTTVGRARIGLVFVCWTPGV